MTEYSPPMCPRPAAGPSRCRGGARAAPPRRGAPRPPLVAPSGDAPEHGRVSAGRRSGRRPGPVLGAPASPLIPVKRTSWTILWAAIASCATVPPQCLDVELVEGAVEGLEEPDRESGGLDGVLPERELVELPDALPVVDLQGVEELEDLDGVDGADDHVVVPAAQVVVDVHPPQQPVVDEQLRCGSGRVAAEQGVAEVQEDADVVHPHGLDAQSGLGGRVPEHLVAGLAGLVLDDDLDVRVRRASSRMPDTARSHCSLWLTWNG